MGKACSYAEYIRNQDQFNCVFTVCSDVSETSGLWNFEIYLGKFLWAAKASRRPKQFRAGARVMSSKSKQNSLAAAHRVASSDLGLHLPRYAAVKQNLASESIRTGG